MQKIPNHEGYYITKEGSVWSEKTNRFLKNSLNGSGYLTCSIGFIHRLLAETYIPNPNNLPLVDHIDRNRLNNSLDNLRWTDNTGNQYNTKATVGAVICSNGETYDTVKIAAEKLGLDRSAIYKHLRGKLKAVKGYTFKKKE